MGEGEVRIRSKGREVRGKRSGRDEGEMRDREKYRRAEGERR